RRGGLRRRGHHRPARIEVPAERPAPGLRPALHPRRPGPAPVNPGGKPMTSEIQFTVSGADAGLRDRLDKEIYDFNAAATGHHDGRELSIAVPRDDGDLLAGLTGWTWGGCGYIELLWVREDQRGTGLGTRLLAAAEAEIQRRGCDR